MIRIQAVSQQLVVMVATVWPFASAYAAQHPAGYPAPSVRQDVQRAEPFKVWILDEDIVPKIAAAGDASPTPGARKFAFMDECRMADFGDKGFAVQAGDTEYVLLVKEATDGTSIAEEYGWVDRRLILETNQCEKTLYDVQRKIMIVNELKDLSTGSTFSREVAIRHAPRAGAPSRTVRRLFNVFLKFHREVLLPGESEPFILIGEETEFSRIAPSPADRQQVITGWIPKSHACEWDTRQALYWDVASTDPELASPYPYVERTRNGKIWSSISDALAAGPLGTGATITPLAVEPREGNAPTPMPAPGEMRFPIITFTADELRELDGKIPPNWKLRKVGFVGSLVDKQGRQIASAREIAKFQTDLRGLEDQMGRIELLFVVDGTSSMHKWFEATAQVIDNISRELATRARADLTVRAGVVFYDDTDNQPPGHYPIEVHPLVEISQNRTALLAGIRARGAKNGGDAPEMVFRGLLEGIDQAGFTANSFKAVVLLGDAGDHETLTPAKIEEIKSALLPSDDSPKRLFAVNVLDAATLAQDPTAQKFASQMKQIAQTLCDVRPNSAVYSSIADATTVQTAILHEFTDLARQADLIRDQLKRARTGGAAEGVKAQLDPAMIEAVRRVNPNADKLLANEGVQLFRYGYVWMREAGEENPADPEPFTLLVQANGADVQQIQAMLAKAAVKEPSPDEVGQITVGTLSGDFASQLEISRRANNDDGASFLRRAEGLEITAPWFQRMIQNQGKEVVKLSSYDLIDMVNKGYLLADVLNGQRRTYAVQNVQTGARSIWKLEPRDGEPARPLDLRFVFGEGKTRATFWYWLDQEREWP